MTTLAPLRRALALRFSLAALVPLVAASLLILWHVTVTTVNDISDRNLLLARTVRGEVEGFLREPTTTLQTLGEILSVMQGAPDLSIEQHLDAAIKSSHLLESVYVVGTDGRVKLVGVGEGSGTFRQDYVGIDLSRQPFLKQALATGQPAWSETFLSILSGRISLAICVPLEKELLVGSFNIERLQDFARRLQGDAGVTVSIVDRAGSILAHPDPEVALHKIKVNNLDLVRRGFSGEEVTSRLELLGKDTIASVVLIQSTGWLVLVYQSADFAYHQARVTGVVLGAAVLATIGLALLFALTQSRRISQPLAELAAQARVVAGGGYQFTPPRSGSLEVQALAESFRQMTEAIGDRERQLREGEEKYRLLFENAGDAIFIAQNGRLPFFNTRSEELTGNSGDTLRSIPWVELVHPSDRGILAERHRARIAGEAVSPTVTVRILRPGGEERWVQLSSVPVSWDGRHATLNFARDITDLKNLEAQALQAQKMEAVGTLAGGVAHDFNNLLQAIQGSAELALMPGRDAAANRKSLEQIVRSAERGADLTRQLLMFSRKIESRRRTLNINAEVEEVARMLEHTLPKMIRVELVLDRGLRAVSADPGQIQQVLLNLAVNAGHAMSGAGTLRIATTNFDLEARDEARPEILPGKYVVITVADSGAGIEERNLSRIFEPFFTTKGPGEGTGLGLSMVFGIVKEHGGHISLDSTLGQGTTFQIMLPCVDVAGKNLDGEVSRAAPLPSGESVGGEKILIVDDEESIRNVGAEMLATRGYRVLSASDGETALKIFREEGGGIDLVLLDMIMPGMGGRKCLQELLRIDPAARVVVTSGYSADGAGDTMMDLGARGFVAKPFRVENLLVVIRDALKAGT